MATTPQERILLGIGILNWSRGERVSDRYGTVMLTIDSMTDPISDNLGYLSFDEKATAYQGQVGSLVAVVQIARHSPHIGDFFRGFRPPQTPLPVGTELTLGTGILFFEVIDDEPLIPTVGLKPKRKRKRDWLDPKVLYQLHNQTVQLYFQPVSKDKE